MSSQETIEKIVAALDAASVPYMLTGSFAASYYGTPRSTQDIDFVIDPMEEQLRSYVASLDQSRFYVELQAAIDSMRNRSMFNVLDLTTGWKADFIFRKPRPFAKTNSADAFVLNFTASRSTSRPLKTVSFPNSSGPRLGSRRGRSPMRQRC